MLRNLQWPATEWWYWTVSALVLVGVIAWRVRRHPARWPSFWDLGFWTIAAVGLAIGVGLAPTALLILDDGSYQNPWGWEDLAWWSSGALLIGIGIAFLTRALFAWRPDNTRRCPNCRYDMTGIPGLRCPECGRVAGAERQLFRVRRTKRRFVSIAMMMTLGAGIAAWPLVREVEPYAVLPTAVLLAFAERLNQTEGGYELRRRLEGYSEWSEHPKKLGWFERRMLIRSCRSMLAPLSDPRAKEGARELLGQVPPQTELAPDLLRLASDPAAVGRGEWIYMLGQLPVCRERFEPFLTAALHEQDEDIVRRASNALRSLWGPRRRRDESQAPPPNWLVARAATGSDEVRAVALDALREFQPAIMSVAVAELAWADPSIAVRSSGLELMVHADPQGPDTRRRVIEGLADVDLQGAALALVWSNEGMLDDPEIRRSTGEAVLDLTPDQPEYALHQFTELGTFAVWRIEVLIQAVERPALQEAALRRLAEIAPNASAALPRLRTLASEAAASDPSMERRVRQIVNLIERSAPDSAPR